MTHLGKIVRVIDDGARQEGCLIDCNIEAVLVSNNEYLRSSYIVA